MTYRQLKTALTILIALSSLPCLAQTFIVKRDRQKLLIFENGVSKDSIMLLKPHYCEYLVRGNFLYYTDGFVVPDQLKIVVHRVRLNDARNSSTSKPVKNINMEHERLLRVKFKPDRLIISSEQEDSSGKWKKEKLVCELDSVFFDKD